MEQLTVQTGVISKDQYEDVIDQYFRIIYFSITICCWVYIPYIAIFFKLPFTAFLGFLATLVATSSHWIKKHKVAAVATNYLVGGGFTWVALVTFYTGGPFSPGVSWFALVAFTAGMFQGRKGALIWTVIPSSWLVIAYIFRDELPKSLITDFQNSWFQVSNYIGISALLLTTLKFGDIVTYSKTKKDLESKDIAFHEVSELLSDSEKSFQSIFENSPTGFVVLDSELRVINANKAFTSFMEKSLNEVMHQKLSEYIQNDFRLIVDKLDPNSITQESLPLNFEIKFKPTTQHQKWGNVFIKRFKSQAHKQAAWLVSVIDISELKQAEIEKTAAKRLIEEQEATLVFASKMSALGEMAAGVAHEINNPLAIVSAKAHFIKAKIKKGYASDADMDADFEILNDTVRRIAKIIHNLLIFSKQTDQDPFETISTSTIIDSTLDMCLEKMKIRGIEVRFENQASRHVECRPAQIVQVLYNLITNASEAMDSSPIKLILLEVFETHDSVEFRVTDSGVGIDREKIAKIMQPFYSTKGYGKGVGLGLSVGRGIAESHRGELRYNEESPQTQFILRIPFKQI